MKLSADSKPAPRSAKAGSVTVKIYAGKAGKYQTFTVYWRVGGKSHRRTFSDEKKAQKFARSTRYLRPSLNIPNTRDAAGKLPCRRKPYDFSDAPSIVEHRCRSW